MKGVNAVFSLLQISHIETGTILEGIEIMVAQHQRLGIAFPQVFEETLHGGLLCLRARVLGVSLAVEPALVAHTDGVLVVVPAVCAHLLLRPPRPDDTFTVDVVMVADVLETAVRYVVATTFREREAFTLRGG